MNKKHSHNLPEKFIERLTEMFGVSLCTQIQQTFVERPTTFRVNTIKADKNEIRQALFDLGFKTDNVVWYKDAFILKNKTLRELQDLDLYKQGKIYVQSLASMVPPLVLNPQSGEKVLDLTAAPGSKTSQIAALMFDPDESALGGRKPKGELVANDVDKVRFQKLEHNLELLGVIGDNNNWKLELKNENGVELTKLYPNYFDKILLDAPCTAEARIILDKPTTYGFWQERNIKDTAYLQRKLLFSAWQMLKPGGILVYSTCTFAPEENELQITKFMEQNTNCELLPIELSGVNKLPIVRTWKEREINKEVVKKALRIIPSKEIEGFFMVKMQKHGLYGIK
ncbi:MAG TPA: hypothetical protein DEB09_03580 [Candidatus Magasanikbacteria bacterium]|nr:hypothetical protein [Candidatus Magasanikbacteria bacterium]